MRKKNQAIVAALIPVARGRGKVYMIVGSELIAYSCQTFWKQGCIPADLRSLTDSVASFVKQNGKSIWVITLCPKTWRSHSRNEWRTSTEKRSNASVSKVGKECEVLDERGSLTNWIKLSEITIYCMLFTSFTSFRRPSLWHDEGSVISIECRWSGDLGLTIDCRSLSCFMALNFFISSSFSLWSAKLYQGERNHGLQYQRKRKIRSSKSSGEV